MTASQTRITLEIGETMKITEKPQETHPIFEHAVAVDEQVGAVQDAAVVAVLQPRHQLLQSACSS